MAIDVYKLLEVLDSTKGIVIQRDDVLSGMTPTNRWSSKR